MAAPPDTPTAGRRGADRHGHHVAAWPVYALPPIERGLVPHPVDRRDVLRPILVFLQEAGPTLRDTETGQAYRIRGIDAPERGEPGGAVATALLRRILGQIDGLACDSKGTSFDRKVVRCDLVGGPASGLDLACALVALGPAVDWPKYSRGRYQECAR